MTNFSQKWLFLVIFNYSTSHLQLTIRNSQIRLNFRSWNSNISISQFWLFLKIKKTIQILKKELTELSQ